MPPLTPLNSRVPGTPQVQAAAWNTEALDELGYEAHPVGSLKVIHADPYARWADVPLWRQQVGLAPRKYDLVVSGTYRRRMLGKRGAKPIGPVMRSGRLDTEGHADANFRGAVAILADGSIVLDVTEGRSEAALQERFGQPGNPVVELMGGGAMLVRNGKPVSDRSMMLDQTFHGDPGGIRAACMQRDVHTVVAILRGQCFVVIAPEKSALDIREDFTKLGFGAVIKFERGSGFYFNDGERTVDGRNNTGFGVHKHIAEPEPR